MCQVIVFGLLHTDRIDATGYTRLTLVETGPYERLVATEEWFEFDEPLPNASKYRSPATAPFRLFAR